MLEICHFKYEFSISYYDRIYIVGISIPLHAIMLSIIGIGIEFLPYPANVKYHHKTRKINKLL